MSKRAKIIVISGPTASGKTKFGIELAKRINGAIISADSMQVYRGLDIGTAKPTSHEMGDITHYLIDLVPPHVSYSVADFQKDGRKAIDDSIEQGKVPIVVGGTGLYIQSLVFDYVFDTMEPLDYDQYAMLTTEKLAEKLRALDLATYERIDKANRRRLQRALAIAEQTSQTKSEREANASRDPLYDFLAIALMPERPQLYAQINRRVETMIAAGLVAEVQFFNQKFDLAPQIKQAIGYRETLAYDAGMYANKAQYSAAIAQNTRRFAKRQITWLKNQRIAYRFISNKADAGAVDAEIAAFLKK